MSLIVNEKETKAFINALREKRGDDLTLPDAYYFQIMTREKYGSFTNQILFRKLVKLESLIDELHKATPFRGFYVDGKHVPHDSLVCYMTPEPRDVERTNKQVCAAYILKQDNQEFDMGRAFLSECQKYPAQRRILDVDVDVSEKYPLVARGMEEIGVAPTFTIQSRGGYHLLCYDCEPQVNKALYDLSKAIGDIDMLKNAMVPIPGTLQVPPREGRFDWEDFQQLLDDLSKDNDKTIAEELQLANLPKDRVKETLKRKVNESKARSIAQYGESTTMPRISSFAKMLKPEHFRPNLRTLSKEKHTDFVIGDGAFGTVFKSVWETRGFVVAVKVLKCKQFSKKAEESLRHEVEIMANLGHSDHVIDIFGFYADPAGNFALVMSYAPGGSLRDRLDRADFATIPWSQKWTWVEGIAKGMAWLHSADPPIIHRDLKSDNILLGERGEARVSDFGCAIAKTETTMNSSDGGAANGSTTGSLPWIPPEGFIDGTQEAAGDVYAFGVVMWEIATGQLPWPGTGPSLIPALVKEGQRPNVRSISGDDEYVGLMTKCWQQYPAARPSFGLIADELSCRHYNSAYGLVSKTSSATSKPSEGASYDSSSTSKQDNAYGTTTSTTDASSKGGGLHADNSGTQELVSAQSPAI